MCFFRGPGYLVTGRLCVMASRHQAGLVVVGCDHIGGTLKVILPSATQPLGRPDAVSRGSGYTASSGRTSRGARPDGNGWEYPDRSPFLSAKSHETRPGRRVSSQWRAIAPHRRRLPVNGSALQCLAKKRHRGPGERHLGKVLLHGRR